MLRSGKTDTPPGTWWTYRATTADFRLSPRRWAVWRSPGSRRWRTCPRDGTWSGSYLRPPGRPVRPRRCWRVSNCRDGIVRWFSARSEDERPEIPAQPPEPLWRHTKKVWSHMSNIGVTRGGKGAILSQISSIPRRFVLWEALSQTKCCCSLKVKVTGPKKNWCSNTEAGKQRKSSCQFASAWYQKYRPFEPQTNDMLMMKRRKIVTSKAQFGKRICATLLTSYQNRSHWCGRGSWYNFFRSFAENHLPIIQEVVTVYEVFGHFRWRLSPLA